MWTWIIIGSIMSTLPIKCIQKYLDLSVKEKMSNYYLLIIAVLANVILNVFSFCILKRPIPPSAKLPNI